MRRLSALGALVVMGVLFCSIGGASAADAQVPGLLGVEARAGGGIGSFEATGAGLEFVPGPAWGLVLTWGLDERIGLYAGYSSITFGCDAAFCRGYDVSFVSRGVSLGARGQAPIRGRPWLRLGVLLHDFEQRWHGPERPGSETTDAGTGLETAAGIQWDLRPGVSLVPGLQLGLLPVRDDEGVTERAFFTALELGVRLRP